MPQYGSGIIPGGALGTELNAVTRRAFVPSVVVQIYQATPLLSAFLSNAQPAAGGVSAVTVPVQGASMVSFGWSDYTGSFNAPQQIPGVQNAEFNLKLGIIPIPFYGMEGVVQREEAVIPLMKVRMADAKTVGVQAIAGALVTDNHLTPNVINGLPQAIDDGTTVDSFGGISRSANTFWKAQLHATFGAISRASIGQAIMECTHYAGGETPSMAVMSGQDWSKLAADFLGTESRQLVPGSSFGSNTPANAGFTAISVMGVPIFYDPYIPKGTMYLLNNRYNSIYMSKDLPFAFTGFYSTIPQFTVGFVGAMLTAMEFVCTKPKANMQVTGLTGGDSW